VATLDLRGIRVSGRHGASAGERDRPQEFVVDLEVEVQERGDALEKTADYRAMIELVRKTVETESFVLLETLAGAVADAVRAVPRVRSVRPTVHKPEAADRLGLSDISATVIRR
jgi:dihydroneopterin aldolase